MDFRRVVWVVEGPGRGADIASVRYMSLIPAQVLGGTVAYFVPGDDPAVFLARHQPAVLIFNKIFSDPLAGLAAAARKAAIPVAAAFSDWRFHLPHNRALAAAADRIVVQTRAMADAIAEQYGRDSELIEECYEGPRGIARFAPGREVRVVWYGHFQNLDTLAAGLAPLAALEGPPMALRLVTNAKSKEIGEVMGVLPPPRAPISVRSFLWSVERQAEAVDWADLVLLPSLPTFDKAVKGHNRLVQAIHGGRLALAFPLPPYRELEAYCWLGESMADGLRWALAHPAEVLARLHAGQAYIDRRFSPEALAARWAALVQSMIDG